MLDHSNFAPDRPMSEGCKVEDAYSHQSSPLFAIPHTCRIPAQLLQLFIPPHHIPPSFRLQVTPMYQHPRSHASGYWDSGSCWPEWVRSAFSCSTGRGSRGGGGFYPCPKPHENKSSNQYRSGPNVACRKINVIFPMSRGAKGIQSWLLAK